MRSNIVTILMLMLVSGLSAQVRPDFFTEETNPTNSNFEVYSQKSGLNRRASLANLRKYFGAQITVSTVPAATGNAESLRNKVLVVLPDSVTYFVDWNGTSVRLGGGSSGTGGGELENAYISNDTIFLDTPDSLYTIVLPDELSTELFQDSIMVFKTNGVETGRDTIRVPGSGGGGGGSGTVTGVTAGTGLTGGTITTAGTISADTAGMLVTKSFLTNQGYTTNTGTLTGTGTTGNFAGWSGASALTDAPALYDAVKVAIQGGRALQFGTWTTAARPVTPSAGMNGYNTTLGYPETYGASAWLQSAFPVGTTGQTLRHNGTSWIASSLISNSGTSVQINSGPAVEMLNMTGGLYITTTGGSLAFRLRSSDGQISLGTNQAGYNLGDSYSSNAVSGSMLYLVPPSNYDDSGKIGIGIGIGIRTNDVSTAVNHFGLSIGDATAGGYMPTTGSIERTSISIGNTINQTGSATGITRGLWVNPVLTAAADYRSIEISNNLGRGIHQTGTSATNNFAGATHIGATTAPARTLHVTGTMRVTGSAGTGTAVVLRDGSGDFSNATLGTGVSIVSGTLGPSNDLAAVEALSGTGLATRTATDTWTTRTLVGGSGIAVTNADGVAGNPTISRTYSFVNHDVKNGATSLAVATPTLPNDDTAGSETTTAIGSDFSTSGSLITYTGASGALIQVTGVISFWWPATIDTSDEEFRFSIYKEGVEVEASEVIATCESDRYHTISLPTVFTTATTNDTYEMRIEVKDNPVDITVARYNLQISRIY